VRTRKYVQRLVRKLPILLGIAAFNIGSASAAILQTVAPAPMSFVQGTDFNVIAFSATGDVTARATAVDLETFIGNLNTSGCEAGDFAGFPAGNIALLQRGTCTFEVKAENAAAAGATGVLIFNSAFTINDLGLFSGTLGPSYTGGIPVIATTFNIGATLASPDFWTVRMQVTQQDVTAAVTVPAPATLALLGFALAGLGFSRRKRFGK
jgi:hypothetical protein